jgi:4-hydroxy-4-methyl-2-oxoglutarate aldolase
MSDPIAERLKHCCTGITHDVLHAMGLVDSTLPAGMRPLFQDQTLDRLAFTIDGMVNPGADASETLLAWMGLISKARSGHIWVPHPKDQKLADVAKPSAETLKNKSRLRIGCEAQSAVVSLGRKRISGAARSD